MLRVPRITIDFEDRLSEEIPDSPNWTHRNHDNYLDGFRKRVSTEEEYDGAIWMGISQGNQGDLFVDFSNNYEPILFEVTNRFQPDTIFVLKFFYNYEEIDFKILGNYEFKSELVFTARLNETIIFPLAFANEPSSEENIGKLTMFIIEEPGSFAANHIDNNAWGGVYMALDYEVRNGGGQLAPLDVTPFSDFYEAEFHGFSIYSQPLRVWEGGHMAFNEAFIIHRGQDTELTFFANNQIEFYRSDGQGGAVRSDHLFDNFVIISMIDWQQIDKSGKPYVLVEIEEPSLYIGQYGTFVINVDKAPGFYEFTVILIMGAQDRVTERTFFPHEVRRFTIEVVE